MRLGAGLVESGTFFETEVEEYKKVSVAGVRSIRHPGGAFPPGSDL